MQRKTVGQNRRGVGGLLSAPSAHIKPLFFSLQFNEGDA